MNFCYNYAMKQPEALPLSFAILARNEEKNLPRTLASIADWGAEIVVIDADSTDQTAAIAKKYTEKVYHRKNEAQLNINKMEAFKYCTREWIFYLDADEEMTTAQKSEIEAILQHPTHDGYWAPRKNIVFGHWLRWGGNYPDYGLRLFRRSKGRFACQHVHEHLQIDGTVGYLKEPFLHYTYESVEQWLKKMDFYTSLEATLLVERRRTPWIHLVVRPGYKFLRNYIWQRGLLDGRVGFIYAVLSGIYDFMSGAKAFVRRETTSPDGK